MGILGKVARAIESSPEVIAATGAGGTYGYGLDPIDNDGPWSAVGGTQGRPVPWWTAEQAKQRSVAAYRANPIGRAVIDTHTAFVAGDTGIVVQSTDDRVQKIIDEFWKDDLTRLEDQSSWVRHWMLDGELCVEGITGPFRSWLNIIDTQRVVDVELLDGNSLIHDQVVIRTRGGGRTPLQIIRRDFDTGLYGGQVFWWPGFTSLLTDTRGYPYLTPVLDQLDDYQQVIGNLVDRTALLRYMAFDVTLSGKDANPEAWVAKRQNGNAVPRSGTMEVHGEDVEIKPLKAEVGASEDTMTSKAILQTVSGGSGMSPHWLGDPSDTNRATGMSMAEPTRRRLSDAQKSWIRNVGQLVRWNVDQAVLTGRLPRVIATTNSAGDRTYVSPSSTVTVHGPAIASADSKVNSQVLMAVASSIEKLRGVADDEGRPVLPAPAARELMKVSWERFTNTPYRDDLDENRDQDRISDRLDEQEVPT